MKVISSNKNDWHSIASLVIAVFGVSWVSMLAAGTLAHHHSQWLSWVFEFSYWDWVLLSLVLSIVRTGIPHKWYIKEEK